MISTKTKHQKRGQLLDQGVQLLMQRGYHGTGLNDLLTAVKIPKGSFYNYFDSKEAFCVAVIEHYIQPFIQQLTTHLHHPQQQAYQALNQYFNELIALAAQEQFNGGCLLGNLMGEIGDTSELCRQALKKTVDRYRDLLQQGLELGQQQGTIRRDKSAQAMADLLTDTWQGALLRMKIEQSVAPLRRCCDDLLGDYFQAKMDQSSD
jgi:TetR/AcrR family transcriptional repressor of nem operon